MARTVPASLGSKQLAKKKANQRLGSDYQLSTQAQNQAFEERFDRLQMEDQGNSNQEGDPELSIENSRVKSKQTTIGGDVLETPLEDILKSKPLVLNKLMGREVRGLKQSGIMEAFGKKRKEIRTTKLKRNVNGTMQVVAQSYLQLVRLVDQRRKIFWTYLVAVSVPNIIQINQKKRYHQAEERRKIL